MNVKGIVYAKPSSSGTIEPKKIPTKVKICQTNQSIKPEPSK